MARYHNTQVNGMGYEEYAYDYIVSQGNTDIVAIGITMNCRFKMPYSAGETLARRILWNTGGYRDQLAQRIAQRHEAERLAQMPWQEHPATANQIAYLERLGMEAIPTGLTKLQASKLIDALKSRRDAQLDEAADSLVESILN